MNRSRSSDIFERVFYLIFFIDLVFFLIVLCCFNTLVTLGIVYLFVVIIILSIIIIIMIVCLYFIELITKRNGIKSGKCCQICNDLLDKRSNFPENFPVRFKICCDCWNVALYVYDKEHNIECDWADKAYRTHKKKFDELFIIKNGVM